jgi:hypothetical protein
VFVFLSARSEEEASCLLRELFSNEVTCVTFSSRVLDFLQICAATAPMTLYVTTIAVVSFRQAELSR